MNGIEYKDNNQFYVDTVDLLLSYIDDGDKDGVKSLLCNGLKNAESIDEDIAALVDGFEGDIIRTTEHEYNTLSSGSYGTNTRIPALFCLVPFILLRTNKNMEHILRYAHLMKNTMRERIWWEFMP